MSRTRTSQSIILTLRRSFTENLKGFSQGLSPFGLKARQQQAAWSGARAKSICGGLNQFIILVWYIFLRPQPKTCTQQESLSGLFIPSTVVQQFDGNIKPSQFVKSLNQRIFLFYILCFKLASKCKLKPKSRHLLLSSVLRPYNHHYIKERWALYFQNKTVQFDKFCMILVLNQIYLLT